MFFHDFDGAFGSPEGGSSSEDFVKDGADGVKIGAVVDTRVDDDLFGGHVMGGSDDHPSGGEFAFVGVFEQGDPEVEDLEFAINKGVILVGGGVAGGDEHHVFGLEIAVHDIAGVHKIHGAGELIEDVQDLVKSERSALFTFVEKSTPFEPFHRHIRAKAAEMAEVMDGNNVVVLKSCEDTGFAFKARFGFFVGDQVSAQHFDSKEFSEICVSSLVDCTCTAKADSFFEDDLSNVFAEEGIDVFAFEG